MLKALSSVLSREGGGGDRMEERKDKHFGFILAHWISSFILSLQHTFTKLKFRRSELHRMF